MIREKEIRLELLPCRYCGRKGDLYICRSRQLKEGRDRVWRVRCRTRKCQAKGTGYYRTPKEAVWAWNRANTAQEMKSSPG